MLRHDIIPNTTECRICECYGASMPLHCPGYVVLARFQLQIIQQKLEHYQNRWFNPHPSEPTQ